MASNEEQIFKAVLSNVPDNGTMYSEAELKSSVEKYRIIFPIDDAVTHELLKRLQVQLSIKMDEGAVVVEEEHRPWLNARKAKIDQFYWERYRKQLIIKDKWSPLVVNTLDKVADEILDLAGDPLKETGYARKGLVVGDVQSGKTATYTAIACKAADARYRLIVLLTGTIENLRRQTQIRLDEGFVGRDSSQLLKKNHVGTKALVGVGLLDGRHVANAFTSRTRDFNKGTAAQLGISITTSQVPILLVCKKNAKILENLRTWLETLNTLHGGRIESPLLLIDDEADSASINTSSDQDHATRTNQEIRKLLRLFKKSSYIGVTATPFANVFIHPDSQDEMLGDDLFPSNFIYALQPPSNYMGAEKIFKDGVAAFLSNADDAESSIPINHKIDFVPSSLPVSLLYAIRCYVLATAIRDLDNEGPTHRSMLVNVSRFTNVQGRVAVLIDAEVRELQREIRLYAGRVPSEALKSSVALTALYKTWSAEFSDCGHSWDDVQATLNESTSPVTVTSVNQKSGSSGLDYEAHKATGLRVIAVGGNSLSRGLTLEGLSTSYFYRNSQMYDTLLQMGRWFGYRGTYEKLCRLFLSEDASSWFSHITEATIELRGELRRMQARRLTPNAFGLKVRAHPDSLIVTARNKMRSARDFEHFISLSGRLLETVRLLPDARAIDSNYRVTEQFVKQLDVFPRIVSQRGWFTYGPIPKTNISKYFQAFISDPMNFNLQLGAIGEFLSWTTLSPMQEWDVTVVNTQDGAADRVVFAGLDVGPITRKVTTSAETGSLLISGTKARVGQGGAEREALSDTSIRAIAEKHGSATVPDSAYREARTRPLLLIFLVDGVNDERVRTRPGLPPLVALGLSFPIFDDSSIAVQVPYKINIIEWKSRLAKHLENDDEPEDSIDKS